MLQSFCVKRINVQFQPGDIFLNKYEISNLIGTGSFGSVYRARDMKLDRTIAVKIMRSTQGTLTNFEAEIEAIRRLEHPNVARLYDFDIIKGGIPCLVMEFVDGRELGYILATEGSFDFNRLGNVGLQVLDALVETHKLGVVHCDLKPENIMLTKSGARSDVVKLIDFGVASLRTNMQGDGASERPLVGTPQYMAPEQIRRDNIGPWTDIYAVGLILIELWTGQIVFDHEDPREVLRQQLYAPVPFPAELASTEIGSVIRRAVEKDVKDRYQDTLEFYNDLKNAIDVMKTEQQRRQDWVERSDKAMRQRTFPSIFENTSGESFFNVFASREPETAFESINVKYNGRAEAVGKKDAAGTISLRDLENRRAEPGNGSRAEAHASGVQVEEQKDAPASSQSDTEDVPLNFGSITNSIDRIKSHDLAGESPMLRQKLEQNADNARRGSERERRISNDRLAAQNRSMEAAIEHRSHPSLSRLEVERPKKQLRSRVFWGVIACIFVVFLSLILVFFFLDRADGKNWFETPPTRIRDWFSNVRHTESTIPGVRRAAVVAVGHSITNAALTSAIESATLNPKRIRHYEIIGTPLDASIYILEQLVCKRTPCMVHVYSDPSETYLEIRVEKTAKEGAKSNRMLLSDHKDNTKPILISVQQCGTDQ